MQNPKKFRACGAASSKRSNLKSLLKEKDFKLVKIHFQNLVPEPPNQYVPPLFKRQINKGGTYWLEYHWSLDLQNYSNHFILR